MMKRVLISAIIICFIAFCDFAQDNTITRIPSVSKDTNQEQYTTYERGFWVAIEAIGGYSLHLAGHNMGMGEVDVTVGYRLNQFIKIGVGLGARYYINQEDLRRYSSPYGMPLFVSARGNFIPSQYRKLTPFWGMELGGSVRDGFMLRPTIGIRFGEPRQAITLGFSYLGQNIAASNSDEHDANHFTNFICLRAGYEF